MSSEIQQHARFDQIRYAQCWEDPRCNTKALAAADGRFVLSVASAGDNTLALLLDDPDWVLGLDLNPLQIYLCELKTIGIKKLSYPDFLTLMGIGVRSNALQIFRQVQGDLSSAARSYWCHNTALIEAGLLQGGKFERYVKLFRRYVLRATQSRHTVEKLLACNTLEEQREVFEQCWDNRRWRTFFRFFFSRPVLGRLGRDPAFFRFVGPMSVSARLRQRAAHVLTQVGVRDNFYLHWILSGHFFEKQSMPPYLCENNFETLKARLERLEWRCVSLEKGIRSLPDQTITRANLSNMFEYLSPEATADIFQMLAQKGRAGMVLAYRNLFVPRSCPPSLQHRFRGNKTLGAELAAADRAFFYSNFVVETLV